MKCYPGGMSLLHRMTVLHMIIGEARGSAAEESYQRTARGGTVFDTDNSCMNVLPKDEALFMTLS